MYAHGVYAFCSVPGLFCWAHIFSHRWWHFFLLVIISIETELSAAQASQPDEAKKAENTVMNDQIKDDLKAGGLVKRIVLKPDPCLSVAEEGDTLDVLYTGYFSDGKIFDSSHGKSPVSFILGKGQVIKGWEEGMTGMCTGEKRRLLIPPHLAYGEVGFPPVIPGQSTLLFEVHLVQLQKAGAGNNPTDQLFYWLQIIGLPALVVAAVFWLVSRYRNEVKQEKKIGRETRGTRKRK